MIRLKMARFLFCIAAICFVAKPFIGFSLPHKIKSSVETNLVVKIFSKRKVEDGRNAMTTIQQLLASPADKLLPRFEFLLSLLFPLAFLIANESNNTLLGRLQLQIEPEPLTVANRQFRI